MKVLVTGAHFTPAKAVIEEFLKRGNIKVVYIGRKTVMEGDKTPSAESLELPKLKVNYKTIIAGRLRRFFDIYSLFSLLKIPIGVLQSFYFILSERPDVVLSFGGYVGLPLVFTSWLLSIPVIIHEQSLTPGLANKISSYFADKVALSFNDGKPFGEKIILTGNPLRKEILHPVKQLKSGYQKIFALGARLKLPVILITGGNQGSHAINAAVEGVLQELLKVSCVIHQTGDSKFRDFERLEMRRNERYFVTKWIGKDFGAILSKTDLVLCRAGANTLTEAAYFGVPVLTVPIANHKEQNMNADYFARAGLATIIPQTKLSPQSLIDNVKLLLRHLDALREKAEAAKGAVIPDAAKRLALETILLRSKPK